MGGGMAAGALVVSGVGILVGIGAYKLLASTARDFDTLPDEDKQIVSTAGTLLAAIQEQLDQDEIELTAEDATLFVEQSLVPFQEYLDKHSDAICSRLDNKNAIAYRQHVLKDFKPVVVEGFRQYARHAPVGVEAIIGGVFYGLITNTVLDGSSEELFVLEALRRSKGSLQDASEADLAVYLDSLSPEQMRGVQTTSRVFTTRCAGLRNTILAIRIATLLCINLPPIRALTCRYSPKKRTTCWKNTSSNRPIAPATCGNIWKSIPILTC